MKKIIVGILLIIAGVAQATLLVEETFNYGVGSSSTTWNGGVGFASSSTWAPGGTAATLDNGLSLGGMQVTGGSAHIKATAGTSFSADTMSRSLNTTSVTGGNLWIAYLFQFDTVNSTIPVDESLQVTPGYGATRTGVSENSSAIDLRYGTDTTASSADANVKNGTILLYVAKFSDMGSAIGSDATAWAMTAAEYDGMMANGGVSEANLDAYAGIQVANSFAANTTMAGNVTLMIAGIGRNESTPSFYVDELRMGTLIDDVVAVPEPATLGLFGVSASLILLLRRRFIR